MIHLSSIVTLIFTYYPLGLTCLTTLLNSFTLFILSREVFQQRPIFHYMRAIAIIDIFILYGWNLDHFFRLQFGFEMDRLTVFSCKLFTYFNHVLTQSSAWLRVWMCINRFWTLNQLQTHRTKHQHRRTILLISLTLFFIGLINLHLPLFSCYAYQINNETKISSESLVFPLYPTWNYVHLALYNIIPSCLMLIFTIFIIQRLIIIKRTSIFQQSRIRHTSISLSILLSACLFCLMTTPPAIVFAFFQTFVRSAIFENLILSILDSIKYTYHSLSFFLYFITIMDFRKEVFRLLDHRFDLSIYLLQFLRKTSNRRTKEYKTPIIPLKNTRSISI